jgi:hypothetical protein
MLSGTAPHRRGSGRLPLIQREAGFNPDLSVDERRYVGYNPTAYRHTSSQLAERAGELWNSEHPSQSAAMNPDPALYASALQDHKPKGDPLRALYGDRSTDAAYELLSGRAIEGIFRLLASDEGARKRVDVDAYEATLRRRHATAAELALIRQQADEIYGESAPTGDISQQVTYQTGVTKRLLECLDRSGRLGDELRELDVRLRDLRYDERLYIRIADDAPPGSERVDLDEIEAAVKRDRVETQQGGRDPRWESAKRASAAPERRSQPTRDIFGPTH